MEDPVKRILNLVSEKSEGFHEELSRCISEGGDGSVQSEILTAQVALLDSIYSEIKSIT